MSQARNSWSSLKSFKSLKGIPRQVRIGGSRREDGIYFHASTVNTQPDLPTVFGTVYQKFQFVQWEVARQPAGTLFFRFIFTCCHFQKTHYFSHNIYCCNSIHHLYRCFSVCLSKPPSKKKTSLSLVNSQKPEQTSASGFPCKLCRCAITDCWGRGWGRWLYSCDNLTEDLSHSFWISVFVHGLSVFVYLQYL